MTTQEPAINYFSLLQGLEPMLLNDLLARFDVEVKRPIKTYSKGMRQKIGIVLAFMCDPEVLILDEPTSGLDPLLQKTFHELLLEEQARGKTIFMSSHIMGDVEKVCQRVAVIRAILLATIYPAISQAHINGYLESSIISSIAGGHINNFSGFTAFLVIFNKRDLPAV